MAGKDQMNLNFDGFEVIVLFVAVLLGRSSVKESRAYVNIQLVNYLIADGKSHWLEGVLLQVLYLIIALSAWFFPNDATPTTSGVTSSTGS